mgnify:CR=1 FL=1
MRDFASTLVVSMLRRTLAEQGLEIGMPETARGHTVALADKRALVGAILSSAGPLAVLGVADAVPAFAGHPLSRMFAGAGSGRALLDRWLRLERYFHSRHRTRLLDAAEGAEGNGVAMEHFDSRGGQPTAGEDLVVAGLMLGLLRWAGAADVRLHFRSEAQDWLAFDGRAYLPAATDTPPTGRWTLDWSHFTPRQRQPATPEPMPRHTASGRPLDDPLVAALFVEIAADPAAPRSLEQQARAHGLSQRTMQRRLREAGWSLRQITAAARLNVAAGLLADSDMPIAMVGLLAGYSDQPHFQREFAKGFGPTPGVYREMTGRPMMRR